MPGSPASIEDTHEILALSVEANAAADKSQPERWADVFTADGIFDSSLNGVYRGTNQLVDFARDFTARVKGRHFTANHVITVDSDTAEQECYLIFTIGGKVSATGQYNDKLRRIDGRWKFAHRIFVHDEPKR